MKSSIFRKSWVNSSLLKSEELDDIEDEGLDDFDVVGDVLDKAEEEEIVERFLALEIEEREAETQAAIPMDVKNLKSKLQTKLKLKSHHRENGLKNSR